MTNELYEKAVSLKKDIEYMNNQIKEVEDHNHWMVVSTPNYQNSAYSVKFQKELLKWLMIKVEEYQTEFDGLC